MGMFKNARDAMSGAAAGAMGGANVPGMPPGMQMPDMANMQMPDPAYVAMVNKIGQSGVEAPAELKAIREVGTPDMSGATLHEFDVTVKAAGLEPYDTTIKQSMLPQQMTNLTAPKSVTVKYDPDDPSAALLQSW
jgi:hypothetical protein